jgi:predicted metal-dependent peptidase
MSDTAREIRETMQEVTAIYPRYDLSKILNALSIVVTASVGTLAVDDRWNIYVNPSYWAKLSRQARVGALIHEAMHLLQDHAGRRGERESFPWNVAGDLEINGWIASDPSTYGWGVTLPDKAIMPGTMPKPYPNLESAEWYFRQEARRRAEATDDDDAEPTPGFGDDEESGSGEPQESGSGSESEATDDDANGSPTDGNGSPNEESESESEGSGTGDGEPSDDAASDSGSGESESNGEPIDDGSHGCGSGSGGEHGEYENEGTDGISPQEQDAIRDAVATAAWKAGRSGSGIGEGIYQWARERLNIRPIDWRSRLRSGIAGAVSGSGERVVTYTKPSRKDEADYGGVVLPGYRRSTPRVAVVLDVSQSMAPVLAQAIAELDSLLGSLHAPTMVVACDTDVRDARIVQRLGQYDVPNGGGTNLIPGIEKALEYRPEVLVVITDAETAWPENAPRCPVYIVLVGPPTSFARIPSWQPPRRVIDSRRVDG